MKAIIVDFDGKYVIVATPKGDFKRIYNRFDGVCIGDEIDISGVGVSFGINKRMITMVAACFLIFILGGYAYFSIRPVTFITLDINPSIELSLNRFDRVIEAKGLSADGIDMIGDGRTFHKMNMEKAIRILLDRAVSMNYLDWDTNTVMIAVSQVNNDVPPNLNDKLKMIAESELAMLLPPKSSAIDIASIPASGAKDESRFVVMVENTTVERRREAEDIELSQGKLLLYDKLKEVKPDATIKHVKEATITQIINELEKLETSLNTKGYRDDKNIDAQIKNTQKAIKSELKAVVKELKRGQDEEKKLGKEEEKIFKDIQKQLKKELHQKKKDIKNIKKHHHEKTIKENFIDKQDNIKKDKGKIKNKIKEKKANRQHKKIKK